MSRTEYKTKIDEVARVMLYHDLRNKKPHIVSERYTYPQKVKCKDDMAEVHVHLQQCAYELDAGG